jgi:hypothetical protein
MKKHLVLWCLGLFAFLSLAGSGANSGDRFAWEVLIDICRPQAKGALGPESPVAWRLWSTQREVFPRPQAPDVLVPASKGNFDEIRRLRCELLTQQSMFAPTPSKEANNEEPQCEVVFLNDSATKYILDKKIYLRSYLALAAASAPGIHLPSAAREIKTEWRTIKSPQFGDYIVATDDSNQTWGLVALHLMTHEQPKWFWATWIHKDYARFAQLHDSFGATANGEISDELRQLLKSNSELVLSNYKLIGSQTEFQPLTLNNPLIEGNLVCSSCMGCHQNAGLRRDGSWSPPRPCDTMAETPLPTGLSPTDFDFSLASQSKCHGVGGCKDAQ